MKYLILIALLWSLPSWGKNPLLEMSTEPSPEQLQIWIDEGADVNEQNGNGLTPLIISAKNKWHRTVQILMDNKARINDADRDGNTALHHTAYNNDLETAQVILTHQQLAHQKEPSLKERILEGISKRFESDYVKINRHNEEHKTPFMIAVQEGFLKYAQRLKSYNANIEEQDLNNQTSLFYAVKNKDVKMVQYLVEQKANTKGKDKNNNLPIHLAVHLQLHSIVHVLATTGRSPLNEPSSEHLPPLHTAVLSLDANMIQILLQAGARVDNTNTGDLERVCPLDMLFILPDVPEDKIVEIVEHFLRNEKFDVNTTTHSPIEKNTFLHVAIDKNYEKLVDVLLKNRGIKLNVFNARGRSPLLLAIEQNKPHILKKLLSAGANPNQRPSGVFLFSPLQLAVYLGSAEITNLLIAARAVAKVRDLNGNTTLNTIFERPFLSLYPSENETLAQIIQTLISAEVDPNIPDNDKLTPAMKAVLNNNDQALEVLANNGADLTVTDHQGRTAYDHLERIKKLHPEWDTSKVEKVLSKFNNSAGCEKSFSNPA